MNRLSYLVKREIRNEERFTLHKTTVFSMTFAERMLQIDRRIIFMVIGVCTLLPLLFPVGLPIKTSQEVRGITTLLKGCPKDQSFCSRWISTRLPNLNCTPRPSPSFAMPSEKISA